MGHHRRQLFPGLSGRRVIITGGTKGIGPASRWGSCVSGAGPGLRPERARRRRRARRGRPDAQFTRADIRDPEQARRLIAGGSRFGRVDVVVSNAGGAPPAPAATASPAFTSGSSSEPDRAAARRPGRQQGHAGPARGRGDHHDRSVAAPGRRRAPPPTARPRRPAPPGASLAIDGRPGSGWTPWCRALATESAAGHYGDAAGVAAVGATVPLGRCGRVSTVPLGRMATPDDVAEACLFLASPRASSVSGRP